METNTDREDVIGVDRAYQNAWIAYVNGIEVPVVSASISYGVWAIPECELTFVPDPLLHRLGAEDRVSVQVFYIDYWQEPGPQFRLMFDGEIVGWSYVNVQKQRALSFSCVDYMQIFTQLFFFFMSSMDDLAVGVSGDTIGITQGQIQLAGYGALYPYSLFSQGLADPSGEDGGDAVIERPIDFAYNVVRSLIKNKHPNRTVPGTNFFAPWTKRTNFHRRWIALPYLETPESHGGEERPGIFPILRAVQAQFAVDAVARMASTTGNAGSIWEMIKQVLSVLMMEMQMLPTAPIVTANISDLVPLGPPGDTTAKGTPTLLLGSYFVKPQFLFGLPPVCNVFFPSQIRHYGYQENYLTQPTRMYFSEEALTSYLNVDSNTDRGLGQLVRDALAVAHPEEVNLAIRNGIEDPHDSGKNVLVYPEEFFKGPVIDRRPMPRWFMFLQGAQQAGTAPDADNNRADTNTGNDQREVAPGDSSRDVYRKYAQYEYHKERYARRSGSIQMAFNPYPVPGFPCAIFDRRSTQVDVFGYVMQVRQNLSSRGLSTSVSYSYGRTFQEMFALMRRNIEIENEGLQADSSRVKSAVQEGEQAERLSTRADPVGAVATAPPEPLVEIRDVIQNFDRADAFYRALFYREPGPDANELTRRQARVETERREVIENRERGIISAGVASGEVESAEDELPVVLKGRSAVFRYNNVIAFGNKDGTEEDISIIGIDGSTRNKLLEAISVVRGGQGTTAESKQEFDDQVRFLRGAVDRPNLDENTSEAELNSIETAVRLAPTETNLDGNRLIVIKDEAKPMFSSYEAAMRFGARPICTLAEYVQFLGEDAVVEGKIDPLTSLRDNDVRTFPAVFYKRIRRYRPGPPPTIAPGNITNSPVQTSTDGVATQEGNDTETSEEATIEASQTGDTPVQGIPDDFPDTREDWDQILLQYRDNVLNRLPPRN